MIHATIHPKKTRRAFFKVSRSGCETMGSDQGRFVA